MTLWDGLATDFRCHVRVASQKIYGMAKCFLGRQLHPISNNWRGQKYQGRSTNHPIKHLLGRVWPSSITWREFFSAQLWRLTQHICDGLCWAINSTFWDSFSVLFTTVPNIAKLYDTVLIIAFGTVLLSQKSSLQYIILFYAPCCDKEIAFYINFTAIIPCHMQ